ncbi:MAG: hypothetical protein HZC24_05030 [Rhodocyclales bacterium]|nr:hypothetical protein [Rhodocyclales bacterium]
MATVRLVCCYCGAGCDLLIDVEGERSRRTAQDRRPGVRARRRPRVLRPLRVCEQPGGADRSVTPASR